MVGGVIAEATVLGSYGGGYVIKYTSSKAPKGYDLGHSSRCNTIFG